MNPYLTILLNLYLYIEIPDLYISIVKSFENDNVVFWSKSTKGGSISDGGKSGAGEIPWNFETSRIKSGFNTPDKYIVMLILNIFLCSYHTHYIMMHNDKIFTKMAIVFLQQLLKLLHLHYMKTTIRFYTLFMRQGQYVL